MKFLSATKIRSLLIILLLGFLQGLRAQNAFNSPYSRFGLGLIEQPGTFNHFGMGGLVAPSTDPSVINIGNPASYSFLESTTLQLSGKGGLSRASTVNTSSKYADGQVNELAMGFKKPGGKGALVFGISPFSKVDYKFSSQSQLNDSLKATYTYSGNGGLNKAFLGGSRSFRFYLNPGKDSTGMVDSSRRVMHQLSIGANMNYVFGNLNRSNILSYNTTDQFTTLRQTNLWTRGFIFDAGVIYKIPVYTRRDEQKKVTSWGLLNIGATYSINSSLYAEYTELVHTVRSYNNSVYRDTAFYLNGEHGHLRIPQRIMVGATLKTFNKKFGTFTFGADYKMQDWSKYELVMASDANLDKGLNMSSSFSAGLEYKPLTDINTNFLRRMTYRVGYRNAESPLVISNTRIRQEALSAGLTIPIVKSTSKFHIGAEYGTSGTTENGLVKEEYLNFVVGFTLTPSIFDRWFRQIKYD